MERFNRFEEMEAWKRARALVRAVYAASGKGAFLSDVPHRDQIRRAAGSALSNISEGFERDGDAEFRQALSVAKASCGEVRSQLWMALDLGYVTREEFDKLQELATQTSQLIAGVMRYLKNSPWRGRKFGQCGIPNPEIDDPGTAIHDP